MDQFCKVLQILVILVAIGARGIGSGVGWRRQDNAQKLPLKGRRLAGVNQGPQGSKLGAPAHEKNDRRVLFYSAHDDTAA